MSNKLAQGKSLLVSINFENSKGGISRVARLMAEAIDFYLVLSLHGNCQEINVKYHNNNTYLFILNFLKNIIFNNPQLIVFDHVGPASLLALIPNFFLRNKKIVIFLHDEEAWSKVSRRHHIGLLKATHILCNSNYTYRKFISSNPEFLPKTHVCLLAGVPSQFSKDIEQTKNPLLLTWFNNTNPYCLFVSRLWKEHRYKGYFELIKAYKLYYSNSIKPFLRLAIVGNGNDVDEIKKSISENGLDNIVEVFTNISDKDLILFYKNCYNLIFPSNREGFGFVFLEAMFFSKGCIGIKDQPAEEIITEKSGVLIENNTAECLLPVINDMCINIDKYINYGLEGRKIYENKFMNKHFIERFTQCISN